MSKTTPPTTTKPAPKPIQKPAPKPATDEFEAEVETAQDAEDEDEPTPAPEVPPPPPPPAPPAPSPPVAESAPEERRYLVRPGAKMTIAGRRVEPGEEVALTEAQARNWRDLVQPV